MGDTPIVLAIYRCKGKIISILLSSGTVCSLHAFIIILYSCSSKFLPKISLIHSVCVCEMGDSFFLIS